jgi:hypothetical protein
MARSGSPRFFAAALGVSLFVTAGPALAAKPAGRPPAPSLACAGATGLSIALQVCAGPPGAPGGFAIQWTMADSFEAGPDGLLGTDDDGTWPAPDATNLCTASFAGQAHFSKREFGPGECVTVDVGQLLEDSGARTDCAGALSCGSTYVFRALVPGAAAPLAISASPDLFCGTLPCLPAVDGCVVTAAYWKDHGPLPRRGNADEWNVSSLVLGNVTYSDVDLQAILETPADGNGLLALAHQLIAAKLNIANGADGTVVASFVEAADKVIGDVVVPPGGSGYLELAATWNLTQALTGYNEGALGPGHCD